MNRRQFLRTGCVTGAGWLISSSAAGRSSPDAADELNIALLGGGAQGQVLMNAILKIPNIRFTAVCDIWTGYNLRRAVRILSRYGHNVNAYEDYREMLARERNLDAVIIATPDFWHARHTIACLEAGLNVYCEKEMATDRADARRMVLAARQSGKLLQIGHQRRSNPRYLHCLRLLGDARMLGRLTAVNAQWNRSVQPDLGWPRKYALPAKVLQKYGYESMHQFRNWRWYRRLGGGPMIDLGSHQIDVINWFLGSRPCSVLASGGTDYYNPETHEWYDTVMAIFEYRIDSGTVRAYYQTLSSNSSEGYFENFLGDQGTLHISESAGRGGVWREPAAPDWSKFVDMGFLIAPAEQTAEQSGAVLDVRETMAPPEYALPVELNDPYHQPHLENFFKAVRGREPLSCPGETGYECAATVLKVNEAVEAGKKIEYTEDEFNV